MADVNKAAEIRERIQILAGRHASGDMEAGTQLAEMYLLGGGELDSEYVRAYETVSTVLKGAKVPPRAYTVMGILLANGYGVPKDEVKAREYLQKAADAGDMKAPRHLGEMDLANENYDEALSEFRTGADRGDITSQFHLGEMYEQGLGVPADLREAVSWYRLAARRGDHVSRPASDALKRLLIFDPAAGKKEVFEHGDFRVEYRAWRDLPYCKNPKDPIQKLNIFVPDAYLSEELESSEACGSGTKTPPIFLPNSVGGYMPGPAEEPGIDRFGQVNALAQALKRGYVAVSGGIRGRESKGFDGEKYVGRAPAFIVDYKAIVRYLRSNADTIPGDTERIVTNGTSAGGALSALAGATGNSADYEPYLKEIGACDARDDVFAASCYCPIHNLEHADMAYEWLFADEHDYHSMDFVMTEDGPRPVPKEGTLSEKQVRVSKKLKAMFPSYVNSLGITDDDGKPLTLDEAGNGSFRDYVASQVLMSAGREMAHHDTAQKMASFMVAGSEVEKQGYLGEALDFPAFVKAITRMKPTPAFDALDASTAENREFGDEEGNNRHFTASSLENTEVKAQMADPKLVRMLNPTAFILSAIEGRKDSDVAQHWRIRHGAYDRDTSLAIPVILARLLKKAGKDVDFALPWGMPHSGDYDLEELFGWIDGIVKQG